MIGGREEERCPQWQSTCDTQAGTSIEGTSCVFHRINICTLKSTGGLSWSGISALGEGVNSRERKNCISMVEQVREKDKAALPLLSLTRGERL